MLLLNNDDVKQVLTMEITVSALDEAYRELTRREAVCRPRIDVQIPTKDSTKIYQWGTMEGGSTSGYFAIRMSAMSLGCCQRPSGTTLRTFSPAQSS